jgi:putative component of toxin-antitoxin plasmid stabilization module
MLVLLMEGIYECAVDMGPGGRIYVPSFMKIDSGT